MTTSDLGWMDNFEKRDYEDGETGTSLIEWVNITTFRILDGLASEREGFVINAFTMQHGFRLCLFLTPDRFYGRNPIYVFAEKNVMKSHG